MTDQIVLSQYATVERVSESKQFNNRPSVWVIYLYGSPTHFIVHSDPKLRTGDRIKIVVHGEPR